MIAPHSSDHLLRAIIQNDLVSFIRKCFTTVDPGTLFLPNWHVEAMAYELEQILRGENTRLIVNIPPRNLKSIVFSVGFPAFVLGHDPTRRIICVSYSQELAGNLSRACRKVMESDWYKAAFPKTRISPDRNTQFDYETTAGGFRLATSVGGTLTGRGANLIIIDDPMKPEDAHSESGRKATQAWFDTTLTSRLDQKLEDTIVIVMQRLHDDDLVGHVIERNPTAWRVLRFPAIAEEREEIPLGSGVMHIRQIGDVLHPEREPREVLDEIRRQQTSHTFAAQYQQTPVPVGGNVLHLHWFSRYAKPPEFEPGDKIIQSWDIAAMVGTTNDFSVCTTWHLKKPDYYLLHVYRARLEFPDLLRKVAELKKTWDAKYVLIEEAGSGIPLIQSLRRQGGIHPKAIRPHKEKEVRLAGVTDLIEAGHVLLPESAPWLADFIAEILAFPAGKHDDQVDSLSQALAWVKKPTGLVHA